MTHTREYLRHAHHLPTAATTPPLGRGIPLSSREIAALRAYQWPTHAAVPWPRGTLRGRYFRLGVFEGDIEIPSHEIDAQTWDMHGVDARWSHLHFVWTKAKSYSVRAISRATPVPRPARPLRITETAATITVDTGRLKAVVNKTRFALFDELYANPTASRTYQTRILNGSAGPEIWENGQILAARADPDAVVAIETNGPLYAVIRAEGAYRNTGRGRQDWAAFTTRIHFWADQEWIRVVHNIGYREDMTSHEYERAVIVMPFDVGEYYAFAADDDGARHKDSFAAQGGAELYLHQVKHDAYRFGTDADLTTGSPITSGRRSNNCWAILSGTDRVRVECYLRNGWQEFPFEAMVGPAGIGVSMQPWHGYEAFGSIDGPEHTNEDQIHKLRYAHTGSRQRQGLPPEYVTAFNTVDAARTDKELFETSADAAASANWQGMMLRQDLYLRIRRDRASSLKDFKTDDLPAYSALVQARPIAVPAPEQVQRSFVFGPIGTIRDGYGDVFDYVSDIVKGDYNPERGEYFGRFRWGAMPSSWDPVAHRPTWHRLEYGDSHYDRIALIFWYFLATGDWDLLDVARKAVKFHQCSRYVNYQPAIPLADHSIMVQWHKGLTPCAGLVSDDAVLRSGHGVHAYSMLVGWLVDADLDQRDAYTRWSRHARHIVSDRDRNTNNNLYEAIQQYEFFHDRRMRDPIRAMARILTSVPMSTPVVSDRVWDAAWPLYLDLFGGAGVRAFFQSEASPGQWLASNPTAANMALCYRVTGDTAFLRRALKPLRSRILRSLFRASAGRYSPGFWQDIYGQPEINKSLLHFLYYLREAGIQALPADDEVGQYPIGGAAFNSPGDVKERGIWVAIDNRTGRAFTLQLRVGGVGGGDLHPVGIVLFDPTGHELLGGVGGLAPDVADFRMADGIERGRPSGWWEYFREVSVPAHQGGGGRYDLFMGSHSAGQFLPSTAEGLSECAIIRNAYRTTVATRERGYHATTTRMYVLPKTRAHIIDWTFAPWDARNGCRILVRDANGNLIVDRYLIRGEPGHERLTLRMNGPGDPPTPWLIDCGLTYSMEAASADALATGIQNLALIGPNAAMLATMEPLIPLAGT
jgi:hypothetical protein